MFFTEVRAKCKAEVEDFVNCSRREGLLVIFKCREENRKQNECARNYSTNEAWNLYRRKAIQKFVDKGDIPPMDIKDKDL